jgi:hypothetical protein
MNAPFRILQLADSIAHAEAMSAAYGDMLEHGLHGGPAYDLARDRFNALRDDVRLRARLENQDQAA